MQNQNQNQGNQPLSMTAPESESNFQRKEASLIQKIAPGSHLGKLYGIVDLGTQYNQTFQKESRRIALLFEFPHLMQDFYERKPGEQPEFAPTMIKVEENFSMNSKANFRKFIEGGLGRRFDDESAKKFNVFEILGNWFVCNIIHDPDKKNPQNVYERITSIMPYQDNFKVANVNYNGINDLMAYSVQLHGFQGEAWQGLWNKMRTKIIGSKEGQAHAATGGVFEEVKRNDDNTQNNQGVANNSYSGPQGPQQSGQQFNPQQQGAPANNFAGQPMQQNQPQGGPNTNAAYAVPSQQQAPAAPQKQFVITHDNKDFSSWQAENWTQQAMVDAGYAQWIDSVQ